jgi:hypothetical protein
MARDQGGGPGVGLPCSLLECLAHPPCSRLCTNTCGMAHCTVAMEYLGCNHGGSEAECNS